LGGQFAYGRGQPHRDPRHHRARFALSDIVPLGSEKDAECVARALTRAFKGLPGHLRKTLTYDNGREMALHTAFTLATKVAVYFGDPHSPWQRSAVETINGLIP
jgi:IS30 family transposase